DQRTRAAGTRFALARPARFWGSGFLVLGSLVPGSWFWVLGSGFWVLRFLVLVRLFLQIREQLVVKVTGRNRSLPHESEMERLLGKLVAERLGGFLSQRVDLILSESVSDRLRRPLRISEDGPLG